MVRQSRKKIPERDDMANERFQRGSKTLSHLFKKATEEKTTNARELFCQSLIEDITLDRFNKVNTVLNHATNMINHMVEEGHVQEAATLCFDLSEILKYSERDEFKKLGEILEDKYHKLDQQAKTK